MGMNALPKRIVVVGTSGSGKTTLARKISQRLGVPHIETDALHWEPNWTEAPLAVFRARVEKAVGGASWVIDGNYGKVRDIVWARADTLVWLDYPLPLVLWRLVRRTFKRIVTREELWGGNRERFSMALFSRKSILLWAITSQPRHRRDYPVLLRKPEYAHLTVVHLRSPRETETWLANQSATQEIFDPRAISV